MDSSKKQNSEDPTFLSIFLGLAITASRKSIAPDKKVGAVAIDNNRHILAYGWNLCPDSHSTSTVDEAGRTKLEVIHAEEVLIQRAAENGKSLNGATIFVTHSPCSHCAGRLIFAKVKKVFYIHKFKDGAGLTLLNRNGIDTLQVVQSGSDDPDLTDELQEYLPE